MSKRLLLIALGAFVALVVAVPASASMQPPVDLLPDGDERPIIESAELLAPQRHNDLLEADLVIEAHDNMGIDHYEYRWSRGPFGPVTETSAAGPTVSYGATKPETQYALEVRAVDVHGWASDWFPAWSGITPAAPNLVVAGDSIASGYTRQWFTGDATCRDDDYSYGLTLHGAVAADLPPAWAPTYTNIAWPGAGVGSLVDGGSDSCSSGHPSQVETIVDLTDSSTWNIVVVTAGINSTNWVDVVTGLTKDTAFSFTDAGDRLACEEAVSERWDIAKKADYITDRTGDVVDALTARTNADLYWTSYYTINGTRLAPGWTPIGAECNDEMAGALDTLHGSIRSGLTDDVTWVDVDTGPVSTQMWAGWPHPNPEGHQTLGLRIADVITS
jgi:hypothetical protein